MSPIFIRPVREQLEHNRLIRHLQTRYIKKKFDAAMNVGEEQAAPLKFGPATSYPDLILMSGKKLGGVVEVETGESVNNLEAMAQWVPFSRLRVPFHLYVPVQMYDAARRLCEANRAPVSEIGTYRGLTDGFDLVRMSNESSAPAAGTKVARLNAIVGPKAMPAPPRPPAPVQVAPPAPVPVPMPPKPAKPKASPAKPVKPAKKLPAKQVPAPKKAPVSRKTTKGKKR